MLSSRVSKLVSKPCQITSLLLKAYSLYLGGCQKHTFSTKKENNTNLLLLTCSSLVVAAYQNVSSFSSYPCIYIKITTTTKKYQIKKLSVVKQEEMRQHTYSLLGIKLHSSIKRLGYQDELPISKRLCKLRLSMKSKTNKQTKEPTLLTQQIIKTVNPDLHLKPQAMHKRERANK